MTGENWDPAKDGDDLGMAYETSGKRHITNGSGLGFPKSLPSVPNTESAWTVNKNLWLFQF